VKKKTHRWARATYIDLRYGILCECGNFKTDQALTCASCAVERRRSPDYWQRMTCASCGGPKSKNGRICRRCRHEAMRGISQPTGSPQPQSHPWRKSFACVVDESAGMKDTVG
jgi:hypothetical protein